MTYDIIISFGCFVFDGFDFACGIFCSHWRAGTVCDTVFNPSKRLMTSQALQGQVRLCLRLMNMVFSPSPCAVEEHLWRWRSVLRQINVNGSTEKVPSFAILQGSLAPMTQWSFNGFILLWRTAVDTKSFFTCSFFQEQTIIYN